MSGPNTSLPSSCRPALDVIALIASMHLGGRLHRRCCFHRLLHCAPGNQRRQPSIHPRRQVVARTPPHESLLLGMSPCASSGLPAVRHATALAEYFGRQHITAVRHVLPRTGSVSATSSDASRQMPGSAELSQRGSCAAGRFKWRCRTAALPSTWQVGTPSGALRSTWRPAQRPSRSLPSKRHPHTTR